METIAFDKRNYGIWWGMNRRCHYPNSEEEASLYRDKGIIVCDEWIYTNPNGYKNFREWSYNNGYTDKLTLDRIDNNGNYEPSNCKWATWKEQANNRSTNILISIDGKTQTLKQWCEEYGLNYNTIKQRIGYGWTIEQAFTKPINKHEHKEIIIDGKQYKTQKDACDSLGLIYQTVASYKSLHNTTFEQAIAHYLTEDKK